MPLAGWHPCPMDTFLVSGVTELFLGKVEMFFINQEIQASR